ncbi:hypothetical protein DV735_g2128, partial [Chaetothyriales sp. CBS 134920]
MQQYTILFIVLVGAVAALANLAFHDIDTRDRADEGPKSISEHVFWTMADQLKVIVQQLMLLIEEVHILAGYVKPVLPAQIMAATFLLEFIKVLGTRVGYGWSRLLEKVRSDNSTAQWHWGLLSRLVQAIDMALSPFHRRDDFIDERANAENRANTAQERLHVVNERLHIANTRATSLLEELMAQTKRANTAEAKILEMERGRDAQTKQASTEILEMEGERDAQIKRANTAEAKILEIERERDAQTNRANRAEVQIQDMKEELEEEKKKVAAALIFRNATRK